MLAKARADASAARLLATHEDQDDGIIGFHAQQACEKALKAVIAICGVDIPRVHDLEALVELVAGVGLAIPDDLEGMDWLTAWGVTMRYEEADAPLDREGAVSLAATALRWAQAVVESR